MDIISAIHDKQLFGKFFRDLSSWAAWIAFLKAVFALPMDREERDIFNRCAGGREPPEKEVSESYVIAGRRAGKSFITAVVACYLAVFRDYRTHLAGGERGVCMVVSRDRTQARIILNYIRAILNESKMFKGMVQKELAETIELTNGIDISIHTCNYKAVRGFTVVAAIFEEMAFWRVEGVNPDVELVKAIRPAMTTIPNAKILGISSPYSRTGLLYEMHRDYYGQSDPDILIWQAPTDVMNPSIDKKVVAKAYQRDPTASASEYGAEFRRDLENFLRAEAIDRCTISDRMELPPVFGQSYFAFADPSGGASDAFTMAIGHIEQRGNLKVKVLDVLRSTAPPFDPAAVVRSYAETLKRYNLYAVTGDRYAGQWVVKAFQEHGITYRHADKTKAQIYLDFEPMVNCQEVELLDNKTLIKELRQLERRTGSQRADVVDHPPRLHDDVANACAGCMVGLVAKRVRVGIWGTPGSSGDDRYDRRPRIEIAR